MKPIVHRTRRSLGILAGFLALLAAPPDAVAADAATAVVFLVRHAEKTTEAADPALSAVGRQRAQSLADLLADARIEAIHSTDYRRSRQTAEPLAWRLGVALDLYDPAQPAALVAAIVQAGGRHLVVGHSNTLPELVALLGGDGGAEVDEAGEYDRLYVVTRTAAGAVQTVLLRYGERFIP